jgi:hypothetical protein
LAAKESIMASSGYKVPLYDGEQCIGRVSYTDNLDYWDGHNRTCGSPGKHLGVGKTRSGTFYLVHGTQWQGEKDYAVVVSEDQARQEVMRQNDNELYRRLFGEEVPDLDAE